MRIEDSGQGLLLVSILTAGCSSLSSGRIGSWYISTPKDARDLSENTDGVDLIRRGDDVRVRIGVLEQESSDVRLTSLEKGSDGLDDGRRGDRDGLVKPFTLAEIVLWTEPVSNLDRQ